mgnify:CR=1 FL=1
MSSTELASRFAKSAEVMSKVAVSSPATQLRLYGLYKAATKGSAPPTGPSRLRAVEHAKWKAWREASSVLSQDEAMVAYCELAAPLAGLADDNGASMAPASHAPPQPEPLQPASEPPTIASRPAELKGLHPLEARLPSQSASSLGGGCAVFAAGLLLSLAVGGSTLLLRTSVAAGSEAKQTMVFTCFCLGLMPTAAALCNTATAVSNHESNGELSLLKG